MGVLTLSQDALNVLNTIMQWIVAPVAVFVWLIYQKQNEHHTHIAVLQAENQATKQAHDREIKEIRDTTRQIMSKLDSIEEAMRK